MPKIEGGYILYARKTLLSIIMDKPPLTMKLFTWMLMKANRKDGYRGLKRGQFFTTISDMQDAMNWYVGYRKVTPSKQEIRSSYEALKVNTMISTTKTTRGMIITILNYDLYQDPKNYEEHTEQHNDSETKPPTPTHDKQEGVRSTRIKPLSSSTDEVDGIDFLKTKRKRRLNGKRWKAFQKFWDVFGYKKGKREAADAWLDIPELTNTLVDQILSAAKKEADRRPQLIADGKTPKMAQGWISASRWEDEEYTPPQKERRFVDV